MRAPSTNVQQGKADLAVGYAPHRDHRLGMAAQHAGAVMMLGERRMSEIL